jgi:hypothetical protein
MGSSNPELVPMGLDIIKCYVSAGIGVMHIFYLIRQNLPEDLTRL